MNIWAASTEGMSYCREDLATYKFPNTSGEARTAKFSYSSPNGNNYAIISVEDACDDKDYDDLLFALNPANAFTELPQVSQKRATTHGVYAFEDMWPSRGDYDMNDVLVDCKHEMVFSGGKIKSETYSLKTYQNFVKLKTGLAVKLKTNVAPQSIDLKRINPGRDVATTATTFVKDGDYYYVTDDITKQLGTTYIFKITYSSAQDISNLATIEPFIYRSEDDGKQWEVHLPYHEPTGKMNMSYFGTDDDRSNTSSGAYYVREGNYPFAFYLANAKAENFEDNILLRANESKPIDTFFPEFVEWSTSKGVINADWYLHPAGQ
jgi:LruC domain-containing protein